MYRLSGGVIFPNLASFEPADWIAVQRTEVPCYYLNHRQSLAQKNAPTSHTPTLEAEYGRRSARADIAPPVSFHSKWTLRLFKDLILRLVPTTWPF